MSEVSYCPYCGSCVVEEIGSAFLEIGEYNGKDYESEGNAEAHRCENCGGEFWANGPKMPALGKRT